MRLAGDLPRTLVSNTMNKSPATGKGDSR